MAETQPLPPQESVHQAGGGQPGAEDPLIEEVKPFVLEHLERIYAAHASPLDGQWHKDSIVEFLHHSQADKVTDPSSGDVAGRDGLDLAGFLRYMTSPAASALAPLVDQDFSWPLANYYISSSHNTYLTGNQFNSDADADAYRNVLLRGCRCVEIDVWDGDDSDVESTDSESDEEAKEKKAMRKESRRGKLASRLPGSLASRLEKTAIGKRITGKGSEESSATKEKDTHAAAGTAPLKKSPSPGAVAVEPRVLHGYTLTKEVSFRDVCEAIRESAFVVTDLPLIVSLEVHCCQQQQEAMVRIMKEVWSDLLLPHPDDDVEVLPSPGDLRRKILVKVKYAPPDACVSSPGEESEDRLPTEAKAATTSASTPGAAQKKVKKASKIIQALSALGVYTRGVSFKSLSQPEATMPTHIFSLSEGAVAEVHENASAELFVHNMEYLMRAYPSGMRIGSSNLDPVTFWRNGIQIVALNWQKWDEGMMLNEGLFAGTGGFVLKPDGYRGNRPIMEDGKLKPSRRRARTPLSELIPYQTLDLSITVLAAQNLPLPEDDDKVSGFKPYVKVELHTEPPNDEHLSLAKTVTSSSATRAKEGEYKARTKTQKGVHPDFNAETLEVAKAVPRVVPELSFVRFLVKDDEIGRDALAAWACIRLDRLRTGHRFVHLLDRQGRKSAGVLLVKIDKKLIAKKII
ncbi:PLC-like phosphodiesterase [Hypoxylon sp. FL1150]|nr:PLC-like phosphodiesterase [Hypoxylon sp. FL1150]